MKVTIVGAGFVGLTLAQVLSEMGHIDEVQVVDTDITKITSLENNVVYVTESGLYLEEDTLSYDTKVDNDSDAYFVCVGTPNSEGKQVISYVRDAIKGILKVNKSATVILKSTTLPENVAELRKLFPESGIFMTNPEFLREGSAVDDLKHQKVMIVGCDKEDKAKATNLMERIFKGTYESMSVMGVEEAMVCKYFLNSYKAQKLNFVNEFNNYCNKLGLSFTNIINTVKLDPVVGVGFDVPGVGFGGSCFPKDTEAMGVNITACHVANRLNEALINSFIEKFSGIKDKKFLIVGKAFKLGTNDIRDSVAIKFGNAIESNGNSVSYYDENYSLSDFTADELRKKVHLFDYAVIFNEIPGIHEILKKSKCEVINTREVS
jgi:UDPglucose 6-dehydrogenase